MRYRLTILTPTLVGDGEELSPIDYMVWKDQVNVLDQRRIFKLFAKGPRLDGYLAQLKRSDKLDFASWGGLAQNYAGRRIAFESPSIAPHITRAPREQLFVRTFAASPAGPYVPGTALKGALRTGVVFDAWASKAEIWETVRESAGRPRRAAAVADDRAARQAVAGLAPGDSTAVDRSAFRLYLLRTAYLGEKSALGWKTAGRGATRQASDAQPTFVEMAVPGTAFEGHWRPGKHQRVFRAANHFAQALLAAHRRFAEAAGLPAVLESLARLAAEATNDRVCLLPLGWGGGFLGKAALADADPENIRGILRQVPFYARAIQTGLPFPKTRRVVFANDQPAALPGWTRLEILPSTPVPADVRLGETLETPPG
jgi:CRISPR-associated protein Csm5